MPKSAEIKQQALEKSSEEPHVYEQQVHMSDTEPLFPQTLHPHTKLTGSWLRLAVDESLGMEQRLPNSFHLFSF